MTDPLVVAPDEAALAAAPQQDSDGGAPMSSAAMGVLGAGLATASNVFERSTGAQLAAARERALTGYGLGGAGAFEKAAAFLADYGYGGLFGAESTDAMGRTVIDRETTAFGLFPRALRSALDVVARVGGYDNPIDVSAELLALYGVDDTGAMLDDPTLERMANATTINELAYIRAGAMRDVEAQRRRGKLPGPVNLGLDLTLSLLDPVVLGSGVAASGIGSVAGSALTHAGSRVTRLVASGVLAGAENVAQGAALASLTSYDYDTRQAMIDFGLGVGILGAYGSLQGVSRGLSRAGRTIALTNDAARLAERGAEMGVVAGPRADEVFRDVPGYTRTATAGDIAAADLARARANIDAEGLDATPPQPQRPATTPDADWRVGREVLIDGSATGTIRAVEDGRLRVALADREVLVEATQASVVRQSADAPALVRRGQVDFDGQGRALIRFFEARDASTLVHEPAHVFRRTLRAIDPDGADHVNRVLGMATDTWDTQAEEAFAELFTRYVRENRAPTPTLRGVFDTMRQWLADIARVAVGERGLDDRARLAMGRLLGSDVPRSAPGANGPNARRVTGELRATLNAKEAGAVQKLLSANARAWARATGRDADEYFEQVVAGVRGEADAAVPVAAEQGVLFQTAVPPRAADPDVADFSGVVGTKPYGGSWRVPGGTGTGVNLSPRNLLERAVVIKNSPVQIVRDAGEMLFVDPVAAADGSVRNLSSVEGQVSRQSAVILQDLGQSLRTGLAEVKRARGQGRWNPVSWYAADAKIMREVGRVYTDPQARAALAQSSPGYKRIIDAIERATRRAHEIAVKNGTPGFDLFDHDALYLTTQWDPAAIISAARKNPALADQLFTAAAQKAYPNLSPAEAASLGRLWLNRRQRLGRARTSDAIAQTTLEESAVIRSELSAQGVPEPVIASIVRKLGGDQRVPATPENLARVREGAAALGLTRGQINQVIARLEDSSAAVSAGDLVTVMQHAGADVSLARQLVQTLDGQTPGQRLIPRARARTPIDVNLSVRDSAGNTLSMKDLLSTNAADLSGSYVRQVLAEASMHRWRVEMGRRADRVLSSNEAVLEHLSTSMLGQHSQSQAQTIINEIDSGLRRIAGLAIETPSTLNTMMHHARSVNFMSRGSGFGVAAGVEIAQLSFQQGVMRTIAKMPELARTLAAMRRGELDADTARFLSAVGVGNESAVHRLVAMSDQLADADAPSGEVVASGVARTLQQFKQAVSTLSGTPYLTDLGRSLAVANLTEDLAGASVSAQRLRAMGLSTSDAQAIRAMLKAPGNTVTQHGLTVPLLDNWGDLRAKGMFVEAIRQEAERLVQQTTIGSSRRGLETGPGKLLAQFRTFGFQAYGKQLAFNAQVGDAQSVRSYGAMLVAGLIQYMASTWLNAQGREDRAEYLREQTTPQKLATAALSRASFASLGPMVYDTFAQSFGYESLSGARVSGLSGHPIFGNPTFQILERGIPGVGKTARSLFDGGYDVNSRDVRAASTMIPLSRHPLLIPLINAATAELPSSGVSALGNSYGGAP
jgi:hypothetical protein